MQQNCHSKNKNRKKFKIKSGKHDMSIIFIFIKHYDLITSQNKDVNSRITLTLELHNTSTLGRVDELKPQVT